MSFDLATHLSAKHNNVTVLCPQPSRPLNTSYEKYLDAGAPLVAFENEVKVVRLPSFASPESSILRRMRESLSFGVAVIKYLSAEKKKTDVLYVNVWPLFAQIIISKYAKMNSIPIVFQIMDIYPEALTSKFPILLRAVINSPLKRLDAWMARAATVVVVISENMWRNYTVIRRVSSESVVTIPTWQDEAVFEDIVSRSICCSRYGIPVDPFTFLFLGNIGPVAGVDFLIRAFAEADISDAQLLIVGDGSAKLDCVTLANQLNLSRVHFISDHEAANVPVLQNMAHVCLLPMKRGSGMSSIPSKLPSYLFSAKPVIATVDFGSDTADFVHRADCGWVGEAEDLNWLSNMMIYVSNLSIEQLECIGRNGKRFGLENFSKKSGVSKLYKTIIWAASGNA